MYIAPASIFAFSILLLLFILPILEGKGCFINSKVAPYYSKLKNIISAQLNLNNAELLKLAVNHLTSSYRTYKASTHDLEYEKDLINNAENDDIVTSWCYLFILYNYKQSSVFQSANYLEIKKVITSICEKNLENKLYPESFKNYFTI